MLDEKGVFHSVICNLLRKCSAYDLHTELALECETLVKNSQVTGPESVLGVCPRSMHHETLLH